ncbi:hypothetical protein A2U01_0007040, partial [Trifolium medium]|nr:hypothetical protein [Trifolium medium]
MLNVPIESIEAPPSRPNSGIRARSGGAI